jgi:hypothetical protein
MFHVRPAARARPAQHLVPLSAFEGKTGYAIYLATKY